MASDEKDSTLSFSGHQKTTNLASFAVNLVINCEVNDRILLEKPFGCDEWRCPVIDVFDGEGFIDGVSRWCKANVVLNEVYKGMLCL